MFLHLGKDYVIPLSEIISIIPNKSLQLEDTANFIKTSEEEGFLIKIVDKNIKSYVITEKLEKYKRNNKKLRKSIIYCTNISTKTLYRRCNLIKDENINIR
ncbi:DUF370 domain-containing protein [Clostridium sp. D2Q-14]|uniref:extracellular matrix regulator RemB n=1 Tax=Anaeromonas gelatinilytica TaxID=2683194 RepID=UPI00193B03FE|nr:extracellular matrix/biofilm biosynthesis regulator RemA family protein [Anaeromonas gelatinilytica]MBS4534942.1 DUF370 domain-containing protein [Anaeromonas gelatinilytica]